MSLFSRPEWPHRDSPAPAAVAGEKDACGVGFLASLKGEASFAPGSLVELALAGAGSALAARVILAEDGRIGLAFEQNTQSFAAVDRLIAAIQEEAEAAPSAERMAA